jgi:hypothetical protein
VQERARGMKTEIKVCTLYAKCELKCSMPDQLKTDTTPMKPR